MNILKVHENQLKIFMTENILYFKKYKFLNSYKNSKIKIHN